MFVKNSTSPCKSARRHVEGFLITTLKHDLPWGGSFKKLKPVLHATASGELAMKSGAAAVGRVRHTGWGHQARGGGGGSRGPTQGRSSVAELACYPSIQTQTVSSSPYPVACTVYMVRKRPCEHPGCALQCDRWLWSTRPASLVLSSCWQGPASHAP